MSLDRLLICLPCLLALGCGDAEEAAPKPEASTDNWPANPAQAPGVSQQSRRQAPADLPDAPLPDVKLADWPKQPKDVEGPVDREARAMLDLRGDAIIPKIDALLTHENPTVRKDAMWRLTRMQNRSRFAEHFGNGLLDQNPLVRKAALSGIKSLDPPPAELAPFIATATEHEDADFARQLLDALRNECLPIAPLVAPQLVHLLQHADEKRQEYAVKALGAIGENAAPYVPHLIRALHSKTYEVRDAAADSLGRIGIKAVAAVPHLIPLLDDGGLRYAASFALGRIGASEPILTLARSRDELDRHAAYIGLSELRPTTAQYKDIIKQGLRSSDTNELRGAVDAASRLRPSTEDLVHALAPLAKHEMSTIRSAVVDALANMEPKFESAIPILEALAKDESSFVQRDAKEALSHFERGPIEQLTLHGREMFSAKWNSSDGDIDELIASDLETVAAFVIDQNADVIARAGVLKQLGDNSKMSRNEARQTKTREVSYRILDEPEWPVELKAVAAYALAAINDRTRTRLRFEAAANGFRNAKPAKLRGDALWTLKDSDRTESMPILIEALGDQNDIVVGKAIDVLRLLGEDAVDAVPALVNVASDAGASAKRADVGFTPARRKAVAALGRIKGHPETAVPALIQLINDEKVAHAAIESLGGFAGVKSVPVEPIVNALLPVLKFESKGLRSAAAMSLGQFGADAAAAVPNVLEALHAAKEDENIRNNFITALGNIGANGKDVVPAILKYSSDAKATTSLLFALGKFGADAEPGVPFLIEQLSSAKSLSPQYAAQSLGKIGPVAKSAIPKLLEVSKDNGSRFTRQAARKAIKAIDPENPAIVDGLLIGLADRNSRFESLRALKDEYPETFGDVLRRNASHKDEQIRVGVLQAMMDARLQIPEAILRDSLSAENARLKGMAVRGLAERGIDGPAVAPLLVEAAIASDDMWEFETAMSAVWDDVIGPLARKIVSDDVPLKLRKDMVNLLSGLLNSQLALPVGQEISVLFSARKSIPIFEQASGSEDEEIQAAAKVALATIRRSHDQSPLDMAELLKSENADIRQWAAEVADQLLNHKGVVEGLIAALDDEKSSVSRRAASAMRQLRLNHDQLKSVIACTHKDSRQNAVNGLIDKTEHHQVLVPYLISMAQEFDDQMVLLLAARLGRTCDQDTVNELARALRDGQSPPQLQLLAMQTIGAASRRPDISKPDVAAPTARLLSSDNAAIKLAAALLQLDAEPLLDEVASFMTDGLEEFRKDYGLTSAAAYLTQARRVELAKHVITAYKSADRRSQRQIAQVLASLAWDSPEVADQLLTIALSESNREHWHFPLSTLTGELAPRLARMIATPSVPADQRDFVLQILRTGKRGHADYAPVFQSLKQLLSSDDAGLALRAAFVLAKFRQYTPESIAILIKRLDPAEHADGAPGQEIMALASLGPDAGEAFPAVMKWIDHGDVSNATLSFIARVGSASAPAVPKLISLLETHRWREAASTLQRLGEHAAPAVPSLINALGDKQKREAAVAALVAIGPAASPAVDRLQEMLKVESTQPFALAWLPKFGESAASAAPEIEPYLDSDEPLLQALAARAFGELPATTDQVRLKLMSLLASDSHSEVRQAAVVGLSGAATGSVEAADALIAAIDDLDQNVAHTAMTSVGKLGDAGAAAIPKLVAAMSQSRHEYYAVQGLGTFGPAAESAVPDLHGLLKRHLGHKDSRVANGGASGICEALGKIGTAAAPAADDMVLLYKRWPHGWVSNAVWKVAPQVAEKHGLPPLEE